MREGRLMLKSSENEQKKEGENNVINHPKLPLHA